MYFIFIFFKRNQNSEWLIAVLFINIYTNAWKLSYESLLEMWKPHDETWEIFIVKPHDLNSFDYDQFDVFFSTRSIWTKKKIQCIDLKSTKHQSHNEIHLLYEDIRSQQIQDHSFCAIFSISKPMFIWCHDRDVWSVLFRFIFTLLACIVCVWMPCYCVICTALDTCTVYFNSISKHWKLPSQCVTHSCNRHSDSSLLCIMLFQGIFVENENAKCNFFSF